MIRLFAGLVVFLSILSIGCRRHPALPAAPTPSSTPQVTPSPSPGPTLAPTSTPTPLPRSPLVFTGQSALHHAGALCRLGPRGYNGTGRVAARHYLTQVLSTLGWQVVPQNFQGFTPAGMRDFVNLIARFPTPQGKAPMSASLAVLAAHYDAPESRVVIFPAASDGAAGCGVLLEIAAVLAREPERARQVELIFWDGEAPVVQPTASDGLCGSRFFVNYLKINGHMQDIKGALVLGAVGHRGAIWTLPLISSPVLNARLQALSLEHGWTGQTSILGRPLWAGHLPLFEAGVPTTLLADGNYEYLDTADDTPEQLDATALQRAATAAAELLGL